MAAMAFSDGYKGWQICKQARGAGHHFVAQELSSRYKCMFLPLHEEIDEFMGKRMLGQ